MPSTFQAMVTSPFANNHILYSLLFFLHLIYPDVEINADTQISQIDEDCLFVAETFIELHNGINIPEALLTDKTKTLRQLADEIRVLLKLTDSEFQKKLMLDIAVWRSICKTSSIH